MRAAPHFPVGRFFAPVRSQVPVIKLVEFQRDPAAEMDTIGYMADWYLIYWNIRPQRLPHLPADFSMQFADAIGSRCQPQRQHRHAELANAFGSPEVQEIWQGHAKAARRLAEVAIHQIIGKIVVTGLNWSVRREHQACGCKLARLGKTHRILFHQVLHVLQGEKCRVALVHVIHGWRQP